MFSLHLFESITAFFRPATQEGAPSSFLASSSSKSAHPPAVTQLQPKQEAAKPVLCRHYVYFNARSHKSAHSSSSNVTSSTAATTVATTETAATTNSSASDTKSVPKSKALSRGMFSAKVASTTDYDCTPESPAAKATGEQQSPVPNQDSTVKISTSISWRGRLQHRTSQRFAAAKNALLHRRSCPTVPVIQEQRKVSEETVRSENTVLRRPSRREDFPIAMQSHSLPDDFDHFVSQRASTEKLITLKSRPVPNFSYRDFTGITQGSGCSEYTPPAMLHERLFSNMGMENRQKQALTDFNHLANFGHFYALVPPEYDPINSLEILRPKPSKAQVIFRKVKSMRYGFRLGGGQKGPTLRRVKTFTGLSRQYYSLDSLKGKSLETLARLGGYSVLTFPGDFVPALMRLPACLVSMIDYLRLYGAKSRNVFFHPGDMTVASRIYDHYAGHVLSVEKEEGIVDVTLRKCKFPPETVGLAVGFGSEEESFLCGRFHVSPVAWAFKHILKGIPGGILGAPRLYLTLVDLCTRSFPDEPKDLSEEQLYWWRPPVSQMRVRAIALAILALTSDMQLDLICAVFGLCSLLDYETSQLIEDCQERELPEEAYAGLLTRQRIVQAFAPMLAGEMFAAGEDVDSDMFFVMEVMMVHWRAVSRQLRAFDG